MTNKEKITILKGYVDAEKEHQQLIEMLETIKEKMYGASAQKITDMPKASGYNNDKFDNYIITLESYTERININLDKLQKQRLYIENCINMLDNTTQRMIMRYRYIEGLRWEEVCVKMNYGWRQTHRLHTNALKNIKLMR